MGLSTIVGSIALVPAALAVTLRNYVPLPVTLVLSHIAATGFVIAASATDRGSPYTTWLLGKDTDSGHISLLSHVVWWPYHLGLRGKLWVQWRRSTEPLFNKILPGMWVYRTLILHTHADAVTGFLGHIPRLLCLLSPASMFVVVRCKGIPSHVSS